MEGREAKKCGEMSVMGSFQGRERKREGGAEG